MHILIVDDEPDILEFLRYNFTKHGFIVSTANDGAEGIVTGITIIPDVIISDILMPVLDGVQMCKQMRQTDALRETPFIFLTAVNDDYKVLHAMSSGANQFVSKPVKFETLMMMVNNLLEKKKAG